MKPSIPRHYEDNLARSKAAFLDIAGSDLAAERAAQIAALPTVEWRGRTLRTIRCTGTTGRGPHDMHVPESLLWNLIDLRFYRCPYHA